MRQLVTLILVLLVAGCSTIAIEGPPGPQGIPGEDGPAGPAGADGAQGAPGQDAVLSGQRLHARYIKGNDCAPGEQCSRLPTGDFDDTERGDVCRFGEHEGELRCMPPAFDATEWCLFVDATCDGDRAYVATFMGSTVVRVLSNDPDYDGVRLMRAEEVPTIYYRGAGCDEACQPFVSGSFAPPYHRWPVFDPAAFVLGVVE